VRRAQVKDDCVIPPMSEMLVAAKWEPVDAAEMAMISSSVHPAHNGGLLVARTLVSGDRAECALRVMNVSDKPRDLKAGRVIAEAEVIAEVVDAESELLAEAAGEQKQLPEHLQVLHAKVVSEAKLSPMIADGFSKLLIKYQDAFAKNDSDLGRTNVVLHDIDTGDARPIRQPPRRLPLAQQADCEKEVVSMLEKGVIEPGYSPWASPIVLVRKKDGTLRFCVDYRKLNEVTVFDCYPLPRIDETLDHLSGAQWFTTLDLLSGYWQVGLTPEARLKSAFCTRSGLYLWKVMPFGLSNAPSTFERLMERVLQGLQWHTCLVYIDDVVVFGHDEIQLLERMDEVFSRLMKAGLKVKPRKCCFFARETSYLGHVISGDGIRVSAEKVSAVREWPVPHNVTELRSFLGTANYYRRFVADFSSIVAPLCDLTSKTAIFKWTDECQHAFDTIKEALCTAPVLAFPVPGAKYVLDTDASDRGIGAVLSQLVPVEAGGIVKYQEKVLGYASRSLTKHERNYCVTRKEMLAVVNFVRHFRPYLYGREFVVRTDHASLQWIRNFKEPEGQVARWLQVLGTYQFVVEHRDGKKHGNADGLSRQGYSERCEVCTEIAKVLSCAPEDDKIAEVKVKVTSVSPAWTTQQLAAWQEEDEELKPVVLAVRAGERPSATDVKAWPSVTKRLMSDWERLKCVDNVVYREWYKVNGQLDRYQLVTPKQIRAQVLSVAHEGVVAGHFAERKTGKKVRELFYWPRLGTDVRDFCRSCLVCQKRKPHPKRPNFPLQQDMVGSPMDKVTIDLLSFDRPSDSGFSTLLVVVDTLTKWVEAIPVEDARATTVAKALVETMMCRYGIPAQLHADQGPQFESEVFQEMCEALGIDKTRTTPYRPQSDGQTERMNRGLLQLLAKAAVDDPNKWDEKLPYVLAAYRSTPHASTGETPNRLMLGREVATPLTLLAPAAPNLPERTRWVEKLHDNFAGAHRAVQEQIAKAQRVQKKYYDKRVKEQSFHEGQLVFLWNHRKNKRGPYKLNAERWEGPLEIKKRISGAVYLVGRVGEEKGRVVSVAHLTPYIDRRQELRPERPVVPPDAGNADEQQVTADERPVDDVAAEESLNGAVGDVDEEEEVERSEDDVVDEPVRLVSRRPQRLRHKPAWLTDYVQDDGSVEDDE
jgi:transposase InsO family protein